MSLPHRLGRPCLLLALWGVLASCSPYEPDPTPIAPPRIFGDWQWHHPRPQGETLTGVWGTGFDAAWAVGSQGALVRRRADGWENWEHDLGPVEFHAIAGQTSDDVVAIGYGGEIARFDGAHWRPVDVPEKAPSVRLFDVVAGVDTDFWVCGSEGTLLHRAAEGWKKIEGGPSGILRAVAVDAEGGVHVAAEDARIHVLREGVWSTLDAPVPEAVQVVLDLALEDLGLIVCGASGIFRLDDLAPGSGAEWEAISLPGDWPAYTPVHSLVAGPDGMLVTGGLGLLATLDGDHLVAQTLSEPLPGSLFGAWAAPGGEWLAVGAYGTLLVRTGDAWSRETVSSVSSTCDFGPLLECGWPEIRDLKMVSADDGVALYAEGLLRFDGQTWNDESIDISQSGPLLTLWADDQGHVLAGGENGLVENVDGAWRYHPGAFDSQRSQVFATSATDAWWPGRDGGLFHFDGTEVRSFAGPDDRSVTAVYGGSGELWVLARQRYLYRGRPGAWTLVDGREVEDGLFRYLMRGATRMLAVGSHEIVAFDENGFGERILQSETLIDDLWANDDELFTLAADGSIAQYSEGVWRAAPSVGRGLGARHLSGWESGMLFLAGEHARILRLAR